MPLDWLCHIFKHCNHLAECNVAIKDQMPHHSLIDETPHILLPFLQSLSVRDDALQGGLVYGVLQVPSLRTLELFETRTAGMPPSLLSFQPQLDALEKLVINPDVFRMEDAVEFLRLATSLTHLTLGKNSFAHWTPPPPMNIDMMLGLLSKKYPSEEDNTRTSLLLPKLEVLEAYWVPTSDKEFLDLIVARLDPAQRDVSKLKHATATFARVKQMDISRQVEYHAQAVGVNFKLDLSYLKRDLYEGLAPTYGLTDGNMMLPRIFAEPNHIFSE
ncbi:hypothetical protein BDZ97DRAFT_1921781 [Flammula alnicola]|nr:hypothetical protein BDZ97DRAFT_1921781 [Flammula alnicola]